MVLFVIQILHAGLTYDPGLTYKPILHVGVTCDPDNKYWSDFRSIYLMLL